MAGLRPTILYPRSITLGDSHPFLSNRTTIKVSISGDLRNIRDPWLESFCCTENAHVWKALYRCWCFATVSKPISTSARPCWEGWGKNEYHDVFPVLEGPLECNFLELVINSSNKYLLSTCSGSEEPALVQEIKQWIKETNRPSSWSSHFYNCLGILFLFILLLKPALAPRISRMLDHYDW